MEHGTKKEISGKEVDDLITDAEKYLKRINTLFTEINTIKEEEDIENVYNTTVTVVRDALRLEGREKVRDEDVLKYFEEEMVHGGKMPQKFVKILEMIIKGKKDYDAKKLTKTEVESIKKESGQFIKFVIEYIQRKRSRDLERAKIRVKHGDRFGEVLLLGKVAYIIHDLDHEEKEISKAPVKEDGTLGDIEKSSMEELEKAIADIDIPGRGYIKESIFEDLKEIFGKDVEILVNY